MKAERSLCLGLKLVCPHCQERSQHQPVDFSNLHPEKVLALIDSLLGETWSDWASFHLQQCRNHSQCSSSNLISVLLSLTLSSHGATRCNYDTEKLSIVDFIVKPKRSMSRRRPVIDEAIRSFPDFANFYEMCLEFTKAWR